MDFYDAITSRCSIRKYTGEKVTEEQLDQILRAGFSAPSAHNLRPWHFIAIDDATTLEKIANVHPYAKMITAAGTAILVCGDSSVAHNEGFLVQDCSAAIQNMLIAINGMGLGGVWCGIYPVEELMTGMKAFFNLPESIIPVGLISVGNKAGNRYPFDKYDPERIHKNQW